jgi:hypothetical protein
MSTQAQILANQANAQKSCGPKTETGKQASSQNRRTHGLSDPGDSFTIESYEDQAEFFQFKLRLYDEQNPQNETECILVRRMLESEWLRRRAILLQTICYADGFLQQEKHFALYMRYQSMHERGFYKALNELQKLRNQRTKDQIGFESEKRAAETHNLKIQELELKIELKKARVAQPPQPAESQKPTSEPVTSQNIPVSNPETSPGGLEMAA